MSQFSEAPKNRVALALTKAQHASVMDQFKVRLNNACPPSAIPTKSGLNSARIVSLFLGKGIADALVQAVQVCLSDAAFAAYGERAVQPAVEEKKKAPVAKQEVEAVSLPPPSTYAAAVLRSLNEQKAAQARADKLNRAKMAQVSEKAAADRRAKKEVLLQSKYAEGYTPLADRKKLAMAKANIKVQKPDAASEKVAKAAHSFVRFTRAQMKGYQAAFLARSGAGRWFSAAERAAYKRLSPAEKKRIRVANHEARVKREQEQAQARQKARKERADAIEADRQKRLNLMEKNRCIVLKCREQRETGRFQCFKHLPSGSVARSVTKELCPHRRYTDVRGTWCRDCDLFERPE